MRPLHFAELSSAILTGLRKGLIMEVYFALRNIRAVQAGEKRGSRPGFGNAVTQPFRHGRDMSATRLGWDLKEKKKGSS
jgi:hypothetical protein